MSRDCTVKHVKKDNSYTITFKGLTKGEVLALSNALRIGRTVSPVADDVACYLRNGFHEMGGDVGQELMDNINEDIGLQVVKSTESVADPVDTMRDMTSKKEVYGTCRVISPESCESCGSKEASFGPCPYAQDIHGDDTPHWLCSDCRRERAADI